MTAGFDFVATSNVGLIRSGNEDAGLGSTRLLAVADGMGGHAAGEVASATVINSLYVDLANLPDDLDSAQEWLVSNIESAHDRLGEIVAENPETRGMGTTLSAVLFVERKALIAHIGDSRVYLLRDSELTQVTKDHTYVQMLVDNGEITAEEAERHPRRNLMIRAIDGIHELNLDILTLELQAGDRFLVCSDGLSGVMHDARLTEILSAENLTQISAQLIDFTLAAGAPDNVTVVVADFKESVETDLAFMVGSPAETSLPTTVPNTTKAPRKWLSFLIPAVLAVGILTAGFVGWWNQQWFVGIENEQVTIFHGIPQDLFGLELSTVEVTTEISLNQLSEIDSELLIRGIVVADFESAEALVMDLKNRTIDICAAPNSDC